MIAKLFECSLAGTIQRELDFEPATFSFFYKLSWGFIANWIWQLKFCSANELSMNEHFDYRAAVERTPRNGEVMVSNPAGCWAFFLFFILSVVRP